MRKFWNWVRDPDNERTLYLNGPIAEETWWGDEVTPQMFKDELLSGSGDIIVWINSPGGDVFAAAQIYNMLMEYKGQVTVKIDGIAASAASVIAMAGGEVHMSPVSMMMIHNPATIAIGDSVEMVRAKELLDEVKESIINAYELKTGLPRLKLARLMDAETWMNAHKAVELGFADGILYAENEESAPDNMVEALIFSRMAVTNSLLSKFPKAAAPVVETEPLAPDPAETARGTPTPAETPETTEQPTGTPIESLYKRLSLISH
jgi:ATP-dependent Clp protease protease subunit